MGLFPAFALATRLSVLPVLSALVALSALVGGCVFTPPPPLPGEDGLAQRRRGDTRLTTFDERGAPVVEDRPAAGPDPQGPEASGPSEDPASAAQVYSFERGEVAPVGMGPAERLAFNAAQGDPVAIAVRDGERGPWDLNDGLEGMGGEGDLWVVFETARGPLECLLYEDLAPLTVGNFLGLARGLRPVLDRESDTWVERPYYDGVIFHRVIPGFMVQSGDPTGTGFGSPGYVIEDEIRPQLVHDRPGLLSMANRGPGTGSAQFFITLGPTPHLDGLHTIFGECSDASLDLADDISLVPRDESDKPIEPETILKVRFERR